MVTRGPHGHSDEQGQFSWGRNLNRLQSEVVEYCRDLRGMRFRPQL
jgi:hypothetical protein